VYLLREGTSQSLKFLVKNNHIQIRFKSLNLHINLQKVQEIGECITSQFGDAISKSRLQNH
jgi:hypothetical protein